MLHPLTIQPSEVGFDYVGRRRKLSRLRKLIKASDGVQAMYSDIRIMAATIDGRLIGSVIYDIVGNWPEIFLMDVYVLKHFRKRGIFKKLLARLAAHFPNRQFNGSFVNPFILKATLKHNTQCKS